MRGPRSRARLSITKTLVFDGTTSYAGRTTNRPRMACHTPPLLELLPAFGRIEPFWERRGKQRDDLGYAIGTRGLLRGRASLCRARLDTGNPTLGSYSNAGNE